MWVCHTVPLLLREGRLQPSNDTDLLYGGNGTSRSTVICQQVPYSHRDGHSSSNEERESRQDVPASEEGRGLPVHDDDNSREGLTVAEGHGVLGQGTKRDL